MKNGSDTDLKKQAHATLHSAKSYRMFGYYRYLYFTGTVSYYVPAYLNFSSVSEAPNMSEPNPELAAQFEKEDAERKAARANRDGQMGAAGTMFPSHFSVFIFIKKNIPVYIIPRSKSVLMLLLSEYGSRKFAEWWILFWILN